MRARELRARWRAAALLCLLSSTAYAQEDGSDWTSDAAEPAAAPAAQPPAQQSANQSTDVDPIEPVPSQRLQLSPDDPMADRAGGDAAASQEHKVEKRILHGFRMGYLYVANYDKPSTSDDPDCPNCSLKERYGMRTPHQYLLGYEVMGRLIGHGWLNVVVVGNVLVSGLEQSKFWPSANLLIGFELDESFQIGLGPNFTLEEEKPAHLVMAGGWTPKIGSFYVPVHAFFIPDVDGNHRMGATVGVNW